MFVKNMAKNILINVDHIGCVWMEGPKSEGINCLVKCEADGGEYILYRGSKEICERYMKWFAENTGAEDFNRFN